MSPDFGGRAVGGASDVNVRAGVRPWWPVAMVTASVTLLARRRAGPLVHCLKKCPTSVKPGASLFWHVSIACQWFRHKFIFQWHMKYLVAFILSIENWTKCNATRFQSFYTLMFVTVPTLWKYFFSLFTNKAVHNTRREQVSSANDAWNTEIIIKTTM